MPVWSAHKLGQIVPNHDRVHTKWIVSLTISNKLMLMLVSVDMMIATDPSHAICLFLGSGIKLFVTYPPWGREY